MYRFPDQNCVLTIYNEREMIFSLSLYLPSQQGSTPLTNFVIYPLCFLTAFIMTSRPQLFSRERGGASDKIKQTYTTQAKMVL